MRKVSEKPRARASRAPHLLGGLGCLAVLALLAGGAGAAEPRAASPRPNVVFVLTDDETVAQLSERTMPHTVRALADGTSFTNSIVTSPLCCPSRAGFISGQYPHNSGVYDNEPGYGSLTDKPSTIYSWLAAAGYRTGHIGRFLLNYDRESPPGADYDTHLGLDPPAGVDDWFGYVGGATLYTGATFSDNGVPVAAGSGKAGYTTRMINHAALDFVRDSRSDPRPFFLMVSHVAPHASNVTTTGPCAQGGIPKPENAKAFRPYADEPLPKPPSFDEKAIGDKPAWVRSRPHLGHRKRTDLKVDLRCTLATLTTVDRGVGTLVHELKRDGELDNTMFIFSSDNGYLFGEHRVFLNKVYPYEESLRVPLLVRMPTSALRGGSATRRQPAEVSTPVDQVDLTATILDLAGAAPCDANGDCRTLDGRSLQPLLRGSRPEWRRGRTLLFQIGSNRTCGELPAEKGMRNFYDGVRNKRFVYVELNRVNPQTGECDRPEYELYDLRKDPYELRNRAVNPAKKTPSARQRSLAAQLASMRDCAGVSGRDTPGGRPLCE